jgi:hypothetical protein
MQTWNHEVVWSLSGQGTDWVDRFKTMRELQGQKRLDLPSITSGWTTWHPGSGVTAAPCDGLKRQSHFHSAGPKVCFALEFRAGRSCFVWQVVGHSVVCKSLWCYVIAVIISGEGKIVPSGLLIKRKGTNYEAPHCAVSPSLLLPVRSIIS